MEVEFDNPNLDRLETDAEFTAGLQPGIVKAYRRRLGFIRTAVDERDFRNWKGLNFEKLKGDREHQCSMRLNDQYRLIIELHGDGPDKVVLIKDIEDYH